MINKRGPTTLPCGTPLATGKYDEKALLTQTHWVLSEMKAGSGESAATSNHHISTAFEDGMVSECTTQDGSDTYIMATSITKIPCGQDIQSKLTMTD